eukprot:CAMPEP_0195515418 /NCGR_PEP_ID=MMETSP0794_2-20130614/6487_1 /TAXON_ID=515487 /ORGANISM="Stephanopyxis turris, Strain CCMP 815" /LENGTH=272 /DNA_ID=CAMNT_0040643829 /DNA_START=151 /DNA_END=966 /DNA_ORIENTATION=-
MPSILCLSILHNCLEHSNNDESDEEEQVPSNNNVAISNNNGSVSPSSSNTTHSSTGNTRNPLRSNEGGGVGVGNGGAVVEEYNSTILGNSGNSNNEATTSSGEGAREVGSSGGGFFRRLMQTVRSSNARDKVPQELNNDSSNIASNTNASLPASLKEATTTFDFNVSQDKDGGGNDGGIEFPCIASNEIVLPGSDLQKAMALKMSEAMKKQQDDSSSKVTTDDGDTNRTSGEEIDECVICMEEFTSSNPRMPTLCGCGANKTHFHLPCLYQW